MTAIRTGTTMPFLAHTVERDLSRIFNNSGNSLVSEQNQYTFNLADDMATIRTGTLNHSIGTQASVVPA